MALRFIASAFVFESALSFRPVFQHQYVVSAECGRFFSPPLKSSGSGARQRGLIGPSRLQAEGNRQRQRRRAIPSEQQPSLVLMLAGAEGGDSGAAAAAREAGGVTRASEAAGVPYVAGKAPSAPAEQQVSCLELGPSNEYVSIQGVKPYFGATECARLRFSFHVSDTPAFSNIQRTSTRLTTAVQQSVGIRVCCVPVTQKHISRFWWYTWPLIDFRGESFVWSTHRARACVCSLGCMFALSRRPVGHPIFSVLPLLRRRRFSQGVHRLVQVSPVVLPHARRWFYGGFPTYRYPLPLHPRFSA